MGLLYVDTGGNAANSGSSDNNTADLTGTTATATASANVVLDAGTDLSGVVTSGATQSTINLAGTSVGNRTIYWITAVSGSGGATPTVTIDTAVTCAAVAWKIGGRYLWPGTTGVNVMEGAIGLGLAQDFVQFNNTPASKSVAFITARVAGAATLGRPTVRGKAGVKPILNGTGTAIIMNPGQVGWSIENLELDQDGASGNAASGCSSVYFLAIKVSDCGGIGIQSGASGTAARYSELTGCGAAGYSTNSAVSGLFGCNVHDNGGDGIVTSAGNPTFYASFCVVDTNAGRGILLSGASTSLSHFAQISQNTVYGNGDSGLEVTDADTIVNLTGNIFQDNGNAAGEFNVEWVAGFAEAVGDHGYNCFFKSSNNVSGLTINATEITTDPQFTNPSGGDFSLNSASPCKATSFPGQFLGGPLGYLDMGAVQIQIPSSSAAGGSVFGATGGVVA